MTQPISPSDVPAAKAVEIPDEIIEVFNLLIVKHANQHGRSSFKQKEAVELCVQRGLDKDEIFENHWFDVEPMFREAGWNVKYEGPAYNETFDAYFEFTRKEDH